MKLTFNKTWGIFLIILFLNLLAISSALAATGDYVPLVQIPGVDTGNFLNYLRDMYNFLISIVGILAMAALVYGGFRYLTSVGNPAAVEDAKDIINSAIIGLVLALTSWLILNEINPDILVLKKPGQIGALPGKYVYNPISFAKCFTNVDDPGYGTQANPCKCADGTEQYSTKTRANLTLSLSPTNPPPSAPTGSITASGKLTDDKGSGLSEKTIKINVINSDLNASNTLTTTTTADGSFTLTTPVPCSDTATRQAVFDGDATYTFAVSNPIALTIGGAPNCAAGSYMNNASNPPVASILPTSFCQNLCSVKDFATDGKKHCGSKFLRVKLDTAVNPNSDKNFYYLDPLNSEMWFFFLTNDGTKDDFNVNVSSYTAGGVTYDCAILITDENTGLPDVDKVIWVKAGATVSSTSGNSLEKDIGSGNYNDTCPGNMVPFGDSACQLDSGLSTSFGIPGLTAYDLTQASDPSPRGAIKIFKSKYSSIVDHCENEKDGFCSFAKSRVEYSPSESIICDPNIKAWRSL